jgi:hypothetical protein
MNSYWFRQRRYGLGAVPANWKGWAFVAAYILLLVWAMTSLTAGAHASQPRPLAALGVSIAATLIFVYVCWRKTEGGWRWRWGEDGKP